MEKVISCSINVMETYIYQLKMSNGISACDDGLRVFVVRDFSTENLSLKAGLNPFAKDLC